VNRNQLLSKLLDLAEEIDEWLERQNMPFQPLLICMRAFSFSMRQSAVLVGLICLSPGEWRMPNANEMAY
jgi:hypothetical protein